MLRRDDNRGFLHYERFEGDIVPKAKTRRALRRFWVAWSLRQVARYVAMIMGVSVGLTAVLFILTLILRATPSYRSAAGILFGAVIVASGLAYLLFALLFSLFPDVRKCEKRVELVTDYVKALLADTYRHYRPALRASKYAPDILYDVRGYATSFALSQEDMVMILVEDDPKKSKNVSYFERKAALLSVGEKIRMRYDEFLRYIVNAEDYECERYLAMRKNMRVVIEKWYNRHIGNYASVHRELIEQNISLVMQRVTDERAEFERTGGTAAYLQLLSETTFYHNPEKRGERELIPTKKKFKTFCSVVRRLERFKTRGMAMPGKRSLLEDYKMLIDAYDDYARHYTLRGGPTLEIDRYRKRYEDVLKDVTRCFHCRTPFHKRYRQICPRCEHFLCPVCGACYCNKFIYHFFSFETPGDS